MPYSLATHAISLMILGVLAAACEQTQDLGEDRDGDVVVLVASDDRGASAQVRAVTAALIAKTPDLVKLCGP